MVYLIIGFVVMSHYLYKREIDRKVEQLSLGFRSHRDATHTVVDEFAKNLSTLVAESKSNAVYTARYIVELQNRQALLEKIARSAESSLKTAGDVLLLHDERLDCAYKALGSAEKVMDNHAHALARYGEDLGYDVQCTARDGGGGQTFEVKAEVSSDTAPDSDLTKTVVVPPRDRMN